jgi:hypothetical protein
MRRPLFELGTAHQHLALARFSSEPALGRCKRLAFEFNLRRRSRLGLSFQLNALLC